ncbi:cell wall anchor protein [Microbacterium sp. Root61]|uniref:DUF4184 family protein n=1 Tax=Microbacterium sp. Root61 TaxID=1736570 RepID=UPI0006F69D45|nr:DUF4184 family protein [Microbacterium sp. Root61]KRA22486.1 cell wall anchor protein [Microbacterium sp. Root61]
MPFTPSHAVVALPFIRTPLIPAAIAIGAMTPDLPLFVRGIGLDYDRTHAFAWLPATILVALVLLLVWRCVLRPATRELAPRSLAARLPGEWDGSAAAAARETFAMAETPPRASWRGMLLVLVSLAIGIATHIVWDLFTHEGRWGSEVLPILDEHWGPLTGYKWLQHGSSAIGLIIIAIWAALWLSRRPGGGIRRVLPSVVRWSWWLSLPVLLIGAWIWGMAAYGPFTAEWTIPHLAYRVLPPACAVWGVLTLALCVVVQVVRRRGAAGQSHSASSRPHRPGAE